ncbi:hypothetical protein LG3211_4619 [Lysobacter gummosus]|nr:hypothetical protein LG3211_4619 [Lysobacter gummosus]
MRDSRCHVPGTRYQVGLGAGSGLGSSWPVRLGAEASRPGRLNCLNINYLRPSPRTSSWAGGIPPARFIVNDTGFLYNLFHQKSRSEGPPRHG